MKKVEKGKFISKMVQITTNVPEWVDVDLDKLAELEGMSRNTFTRKWIVDALNKEKLKGVGYERERNEYFIK